MKKLNKRVKQAIEYSVQNPTISITKVGQIFNVDRHQIAKYKKHNLYKKYNIVNQTDNDDAYLYYFDEDELSFIQLYLNNSTSSYKELLQIYNGKSKPPERRALYHWLNILGKEKTEGKNIKYHYDRKKFQTIQTEEDAYWLGFITADGCIVDNKWLQIQLAEKDENHLLKFCYYMGLNKKESTEIIKHGFGGAYTKDNPTCNIKICSIEIINNLKNKGIEPKKSGKEKPYLCSSVELEKAYVRGLVDGDGYLRSTEYGFGIVGSKDICLYVKDFINNNIEPMDTVHLCEHGIIWKLQVGGKYRSAKIINYLYQNAHIYLNRKYELYQTKYKNI